MSDLSPAVHEAAAWLAAQAEPVPRAVLMLKERFSLSPLQACQAIALARTHPPTAGEATVAPADGG